MMHATEPDLILTFEKNVFELIMILFPAWMTISEIFSSEILFKMLSV